MAKTEIFVSDLCPHCNELIKEYEEHPENFEGVDFINITESMLNLKKFLNYRDNLEDYKELKEAGKVGIPTKVIDGERVELFDQI